MIKETIYKRDSKGKIRFLTYKAEKGFLHQSSGLINGKEVEQDPKFCIGKNIGKSNETTPEEQAIKEMYAKITKKLKVEYFKTILEAETVDVILPMLAKDFGDYSDDIDYDTAYIQPKLDGMRGLDMVSHMISRENETVKKLDHIEITRPDPIDYTFADGELYAHGLNFEENMTLINAGDELIKFWMYDVVSELPFIDRYALAMSIVNKSTNCILTPTYKVHSEEEVLAHHEIFKKDGYEGSIVRWGNEGYAVKKRSKNLLKLKDFKDIACEIIDIQPAKNKPMWGRPTLRWTKPNGKTVDFSAGTKNMTHAKIEDLLTNKQNYIGKTAEVRYFEEFSSGIPRFPKMHGIRLDK